MIIIQKLKYKQLPAQMVYWGWGGRNFYLRDGAASQGGKWSEGHGCTKYSKSIEYSKTKKIGHSTLEYSPDPFFFLFNLLVLALEYSNE